MSCRNLKNINHHRAEDISIHQIMNSNILVLDELSVEYLNNIKTIKINMNYSKIIIKPILSEKANKLSSLKRQYVFEVQKASNKLQIKAAIEKKFDVKVDKVRTINFKGK